MTLHIDHVGENGAYEGNIPGIVNTRSKIPVRNNQKMIYSEADTDSDCLLPIRFRDLREHCVHAHKKYCFNRLFRQNTPFNRGSGMPFQQGDFCHLFCHLIYGHRRS